MRVLLVLLLIGLAGCGVDDNSPVDVVAPSSPAVTPVKAENTEAGGPKPKADKPAAQEAATDPVAALEKLGAIINRNENGEVVKVSRWKGPRKITDADVVHLKEHTKLTDLSLGATAITDEGLVHLKGLAGLQMLSLSRCPAITDAGLVHLNGLAELRELYLGATRITNAGLVHLKGLTKLRELYLSRCPAITDAGLVHLKMLTNLQTLRLTDNQITDAGLVHLKGLTKLKRLHLWNSGDGEPKVTDAGVAELKKSLPNCKIINSLK